MKNMLFPCTGVCQAIIFSPNRRFCAILFENGTLFNYHVKKARKVQIQWVIHNNISPRAAACIAWSPTGKYIALSLDDHQLFIIHSKTGKIKCQKKLSEAYQKSLIWTHPEELFIIDHCLNGSFFRPFCPGNKQFPRHHQRMYGSIHGFLPSVSSRVRTLALSTSDGTDGFNSGLLIMDPIQSSTYQDLAFRIRMDSVCAVASSSDRIACLDVENTQMTVYSYRRQEFPDDPLLEKRSSYRPEHEWLNDHLYDHGWCWFDEKDQPIVTWDDTSAYVAIYFPTVARIYIVKVDIGRTSQVINLRGFNMRTLAWGPNNMLAWGGEGYFYLHEVQCPPTSGTMVIDIPISASWFNTSES